MSERMGWPETQLIHVVRGPPHMVLPLTPFPPWSPPRGLGFSGSPETTGEAPRAAFTWPTPPTGPIELVCPRWSHQLDVEPAPGGLEQPPETARRRPVICSGHGDADHARARLARDARLTG